MKSSNNEEFIPYNNIKGDFSLSEKLKESVLLNMPDHFDLLEKAYYIYRRLCDMFYYDEEYFCYNNGTKYFLRKEKPYVDHNDITRLSNITGSSGLVCTEITMIYSKFLDLFGIPYQILDYDDNKDVSYTESHLKVRLKVDNYLIDADAGHGVFNSDMSSAKIFQEINSFTPVKNVSEEEKEEIKNKKAKVDEYYSSVFKDNEFNDALQIYKDNYAKYDNLSFEEKVDEFKKIVKIPNYPFIVMFSWVKELEDKMFGADNHHCHAEFFINNCSFNPDSRYELALVIIHNEEEDLYDDELTNTYIVITEDRSERTLDMLGFYEKLNLGILDYTSYKRKKKFEQEEEQYEKKSFRRH